MINDFFSLELWLIIGVICLILEFAAIPNVGFLFLGFGALSNAIIIHLYPLSINYQFIILGFTSFIWFALLWLPLKKYIYKNNQDVGYSDMVGQSVQVYSAEIKPHSMGQVKWSGVVMNAKLESDEHSIVIVGETLFIKKVQGNVLICSKAKH